MPSHSSAATFPLTGKPREKGKSPFASASYAPLLNTFLLLLNTFYLISGHKTLATVVTHILFRLTSASTTYRDTQTAPNFRSSFQEARDYTHVLLCKSSKICRLIPLALFYIRRIASFQSRNRSGGEIPKFAPGCEKYLLGVGLMIAQKNTSDVCFASTLWYELLHLESAVCIKFEREFLNALGFNLFVPERLYHEWIDRINLFSRQVLDGAQVSSSSLPLPPRADSAAANPVEEVASAGLVALAGAAATAASSSGVVSVQ
ncbi:MAG: hypothetical protein SGCHY_003470 [Lobulomycetales sp.]